jgi:hypothetical protein
MPVKNQVDGAVIRPFLLQRLFYWLQVIALRVYILSQYKKHYEAIRRYSFHNNYFGSSEL